MGYTIWPDGPAGEGVEAIYKERFRQEELKAKGKFAYTCADLEMTHPERLTVLGEEFGEVCHEVNEGIGEGRSVDKAKLRKELIQVAAVALGWIERLDADIYNESRKKT
jgi:NTP pyrophosphatase (non-canonical NTP hydrolase)